MNHLLRLTLDVFSLYMFKQEGLNKYFSCFPPFFFFFCLFGDLGGGLLRGRERFDQLVVVQDVPRRVAEQEQDTVLDLLEFFLHLRV